jgi:hypothetical protein
MKGRERVEEAKG